LRRVYTKIIGEMNKAILIYQRQRNETFYAVIGTANVLIVFIYIGLKGTYALMGKTSKLFIENPRHKNI